MTFTILNPITAPFWGGGEEWKEGSEPAPSFQAQCSTCNRLSSPAPSENAAVMGAIARGWTLRLPQPLATRAVSAATLCYGSEVFCRDCADRVELET